jgi:hypothetical protein
MGVGHVDEFRLQHRAALFLVAGIAACDPWVCYRAFAPESSREEDAARLVQGVSELESLDPAFAGEEGLHGTTDNLSICGG